MATNMKQHTKQTSTKRHTAIIVAVITSIVLVVAGAGLIYWLTRPADISQVLPQVKERLAAVTSYKATVETELFAHQVTTKTINGEKTTTTRNTKIPMHYTADYSRDGASAVITYSTTGNSFELRVADDTAYRRKEGESDWQRGGVGDTAKEFMKKLDDVTMVVKQLFDSYGDRAVLHEEPDAYILSLPVTCEDGDCKEQYELAKKLMIDTGQRHMTVVMPRANGEVRNDRDIKVSADSKVELRVDKKTKQPQSFIFDISYTGVGDNPDNNYRIKQEVTFESINQPVEVKTP